MAQLTTPRPKGAGILGSLGVLDIALTKLLYGVPHRCTNLDFTKLTLYKL